LILPPTDPQVMPQILPCVAFARMRRPCIAVSWPHVISLEPCL
jgi:hypothetical protein